MVLEKLSFVVETAEEFDNLFKRTEGWTGSDVGFSIPLDQLSISACGEGKTALVLWLFGDTALGSVEEDGSRKDCEIINNSFGLSEKSGSSSEDVTFFWRDKGKTDKLSSVFLPSLEKLNTGVVYWPGHAIAICDDNDHKTLFVFLYDIVFDDSSFDIVGTSLAKIKLSATKSLENSEKEMYQVSKDIIKNEIIGTPLYLPKKEKERKGDLTFGSWILSEREFVDMENEYVDEDNQKHGKSNSFLYVYGVQNDAVKKLKVARVREKDFENFERWEFWDGKSWVDDIKKCASMSENVSNELSIIPVLCDDYIGPDCERKKREYKNEGKLRFLLICQHNGIGNKIIVKIGDSPQGPFDKEKIVYECEENLVYGKENIKEILTYNAKAHPIFSEKASEDKKDKILISYNVNTNSWTNKGKNLFYTNADIYRPRFLWLYLPKELRLVKTITQKTSDSRYMD